MNLVLSTALLFTVGAPAAQAPEPSLADMAAVTPSAVDLQVAAHDEALQEGARTQPVSQIPGLQVLHASVDRNLAYTFKKSLGDAGDAVAATTARLFVWGLDLRKDLQRGDHVQVAWTTSIDDLPVIEAARYRSIKLGKELTAYRFQASGDAHPSYWTAEGEEVPHRLKDCPLRGNYEQITSLLKDRPTHKGMDFKVPVGTEVVTPRAGTVVRANWNVMYNGNSVEVRWADGTLARFLHLSDTKVQAGQSLAAGAVVGLTGNTGRSTAPHLHYELERGGRTLDPAVVHGTTQRTLPARDRARFDEERIRLDAALTADGA